MHACMRELESRAPRLLLSWYLFVPACPSPWLCVHVWVLCWPAGAHFCMPSGVVQRGQGCVDCDRWIVAAECYALLVCAGVAGVCVLFPSAAHYVLLRGVARSGTFVWTAVDDGLWLRVVLRTQYHVGGALMACFTPSGVLLPGDKGLLPSLLLGTRVLLLVGPPLLQHPLVVVQGCQLVPCTLWVRAGVVRVQRIAAITADWHTRIC